MDGIPSICISMRRRTCCCGPCALPILRSGLTPTQVDYADYRDVSGIKIPFKRTIYWLDGRVIIEVNDMQINVNVDSQRFGKPVAPAAKRVAK